MDEEILEKIRQKHELSVINAREINRALAEKERLLRSLDLDIITLKQNLMDARTVVTEDRKAYEDALYEFWEINNE